MKTLTFIFAVSLYGTSALAFSVNSGSLTPTMIFPGDDTSSEVVTMERISVDD